MVLTGALLVALCVGTPHLDPGVFAVPVLGLFLGGFVLIAKGIVGRRTD